MKSSDDNTVVPDSTKYIYLSYHDQWDFDGAPSISPWPFETPDELRWILYQISIF